MWRGFCASRIALVMVALCVRRLSSRLCFVRFKVKDGGPRVVKNHHETFEFSFAGDCRVWGNWNWKIETRIRISGEIWR